MKSVPVSLFDGAVQCNSYSELLAACGTHRRDSRFIRTFESPEAMARSLMPSYSTDEELIQALKDNIKNVRSGAYTIIRRGRPVFRTVNDLDKATKLCEILKAALVNYCEANSDEIDSLDESIVNDINILIKSEPMKIKSYINSLNRGQRN